MDHTNLNDSSTAERNTRNPLVFILGLLILLLIGIGFYYFYPTEQSEPNKSIPAADPIPGQLTDKEKLPVTVPSSFEAEDVNEEFVEEIAKPPSVLPELDQSDGIVREITPAVFNHSDFQAWLIPDGLIRKFTLVIDNISRGDLVRKALKSYAPKGKFRAREINDNLYTLDTRSYLRFNSLVEIVDSLDARAALALYDKLKPLFQQAYEELGYPDQDFDQALLGAADTILVAPVIEGKIQLYRPSVTYKFADRDLEELNPVHKQMVRMGPKNTKIIQAKIREFAELLRGIEPEPEAAPE